jgi:hypothetical protein
VVHIEEVEVVGMGREERKVRGEGKEKRWKEKIKKIMG